MKRKIFGERGQALILIALAAVGLFAVAGLAIDGSAKYSDRRHAQNAADTAALAGALAKVNPQPGDPPWNIVALNRAGDNGYDNSHNDSNGPTNDVSVNSPPVSGMYAACNDPRFDCHDYVQVIITSHVRTWFARVVGIEETQNHVEALSSAISAVSNFNFGGNAIVALSPDGCALRAGGNTDVVVNGGGMFSNSLANCAFQKTTCSGNIDVNDENGNEAGITMVGGYTLNTNCWDPNQAYLTAGGARQYSFPPPFQDPPVPAECLTNGTKTNDNAAGTTTLTPGYFNNLPPSGGGPTKKTVYLRSGVYCIGSSFGTSGLDVVTIYPGDTAGVFIYIMPGGTFNLNSSTVVQLWAPDSGLYAHFLIYAAPNYANSSPPPCTINGNSLTSLQGTIYAPYCNLNVNGSSGTVLAAQLIAYTVDLTGASGVTLTYNDDTNAIFNYPNQVGLTR
jgi:hypothetical protein